MVESPKVSVIVPCYNHEDYVEQAIESVINQSYSNIELIVIDDGSSDGSVKVISDMAKNYGFTFISQENMGVCKTLNNAINKISTGKYLSLLASDDYWHVNKVQKQVEELINSPLSEFCYTQAIEFDSLSGKELRVFPKKEYRGHVLNDIFFRQPYAAGSIMFTRNLFDRSGGFDESLEHEDWDFSMRCASLTMFTSVNEPLFYYRSHSKNLSKTSGRKGVFQQKMKTLAKNYHLVTPRVWLQSVLLHFLHDHLLYKLKFLNLKRFFY